MNKNQKIMAKGFLFGMWVKNHNHLVKAYLCLVASGVYGIRAAREANTLADAALEKLDTERMRPVVVIDP